MRIHKLMLHMAWTFCLVSLSVSGELLLKPGGWVDIQPAVRGNRVSMISSSGDTFLVVFGNLGTSEIIILDNTLVEKWRWSVPGSRQLALLTSSGVVLGAVKSQRDGPAYSICRYALDGREVGGCVSGPGLPHKLEALGDTVYLIGSAEVHQVEWDRACAVKVAAESIQSNVIPLSVSAGNTLVRVDPLSGRAIATVKGQGGSRQALMLSPSLAQNAATRHSQEGLIWQALSWRGSEIWLAQGRFNVYSGMPIFRFDLGLNQIGSFSMEIPAFNDLKRPPNQGTVYSNPTGHLVTDFLAASTDRLVAVERNSARLVWYDLRPMR